MSVSPLGWHLAACTYGRISPGSVRHYRECLMRGIARMTPAIDRM